MGSYSEKNPHLLTERGLGNFAKILSQSKDIRAWFDFSCQRV